MALVVTIVVLLILAGITIIYVFGENGIFKLAQDAKDQTEQAKKDEQEYFNNVNDTINKYLDDNSGGSNPTDKVEVSTITDITTKNTPAEDSLGNPITIPEGFKVVPDGQDDVEYTYTGDKKPTVQDGIVIEDNEGNQFVWIPVGTIKNKDNTTTIITLGRYTFDVGSYDSTTKTYNGTGKETLVQEAVNYSLVTDNTIIDHIFQELETSSYGNTTAKSLSAFVSRTNSHGGYYLARYEASKGEDNKAKSKSATVWKNITQTEAATKAREIYTSTNFESDLVNSYAWDTAIVFIQTYSGDNDYSKEVGPTFSSTLKNTGSTADKRCNIYDMASNTVEWTTETSTTEDSYTIRGGYFPYGVNYTAGRYNVVTSNRYDNISFRLSLYVK